MNFLVHFEMNMNVCIHLEAWALRIAEDNEFKVCFYIEESSLGTTPMLIIVSWEIIQSRNFAISHCIFDIWHVSHIVSHVMSHERNWSVKQCPAATTFSFPSRKTPFSLRSRTSVHKASRTSHVYTICCVNPEEGVNAFNVSLVGFLCSIRFRYFLLKQPSPGTDPVSTTHH